MSGVYIPPDGLSFRLVGYVSQHVLFSRDEEPQVGHTPVTGVYPDQFFTLIKGTGDRNGLFAIKSKKTGKVLYSRWNQKPDVWHTHGDGQYPDNWFRLEGGWNQYAKHFRLVCPATNTVIFSRTSANPQLDNVMPAAAIFPDHYFSYLFEDMNVDRIAYELKLGKIISSTPKILASQTIVNDSNVDQQVRFDVSETETHTSSFEQSSGFSISVGTSFEASVPFVGGAEFSVDITTEHTWTSGQSTEFGKTYTTSFPVNAGPHSTVTAVSTVNKGEIEVPYTMYLSSKAAGIKAETKGVWRGVSTWDIRHTISQVAK